MELSVRNATLEQVLDYVTKSVGYRYDIESGAVIVRKGRENQSNLNTEFYPISRSAVIRMIGYDRTRSREEEEAALRAFFARAGVQF